MDSGSAVSGLGGPKFLSEDAAAGSHWAQQFYACMSGGAHYTGVVEAPYRVPYGTAQRPVLKSFQTVGPGEETSLPHMSSTACQTPLMPARGRNHSLGTRV